MKSSICLIAECKVGDLDLDRGGDGRWNIEWMPIQCAVGNTSFQYAYEGSNSFFIKLKVLNTRVPVETVQMKVGDDYIGMMRSRDNAFIMSTGGPFVYPLRLRLTSIDGDIVEDSLLSGPTGTVQGASQFPVKTDLVSVNTTSTSSGVSTEGAAGPVSVCNVTLEAYSACGGSNVGSGDAQIPGSCCPDGFSCVRQASNRYYWQCVPDTTVPSEESVPQTSASQSKICALFKSILTLPQFSECQSQ